MRLAAKLGFFPVDERVLFRLPAVMATKERVFTPLPREVSLGELVSKDNFYSRLEERLALLAHSSGPSTGRWWS